MGLLDQFSNLNEDQTQGLLAAAAQMLQQSGPSRTPTGFGQIAGGGMMAYQGAMTEAKKRKQEEEQQRQMAEMRALQMQDMRGGLQDRDRARMLHQQIAGAARDSYRTPEQQASSLPGGPTIANAEQIPNMKGGFDTNAFVDRAMQINPLEGMKYRQQFAKQRELKETTNETVDGQTVKVNWFKDGSHEIVKGVQPRDELKFMNLKDRQVAYNPFGLQAGQQFKSGIDPDTVYSGGVTMRGQNMSDARAREFNDTRVEENRQKALIGKAPTEFQGKSAAFGLRAAEADKTLNELEGKYNPAAINSKQSVEGVWGIGGMMGAATNKFALNGSDQRAEQSQRDFVNAVLRQESGAAIGESEFLNAKKQYFPQPGDGDEVIAQKATNRQLAIQGLNANAGRHALTAPPKPLAPPKKSAIKGQVTGGYRFKGGDPADENNWEKI